MRVRAPAALLVALLALVVALLLPVAATAQTFPPLTGRVVDAAHLLQPGQVAALDAKLAGIEQATGHQLVIATIPDMQGYPLEDYGYRLGRAWGIGGKDKNDGLLILLAPNNPPGQRGPRIEVGYGLEPLVTDAFASVVANSVMTPLLRAGDIYGALDKGVDALAEQIRLTPAEAAKRTAEATQRQARSARVSPAAVLFWLVVFFVVILPMVGVFGRRGRSYRGSAYRGSGVGDIVLWSALGALANSGRSGDGNGGGWGGGGGGGGFSGGGGSFGGGGASGGW